MGDIALTSGARDEGDDTSVLAETKTERPDSLRTDRAASRAAHKEVIHDRRREA